MNTCETVKNEMVNSQPGLKVDTFEKVVCTERSQAGDSNSATQTKNARSKPFSRAKNEVAGLRYVHQYSRQLGGAMDAKSVIAVATFSVSSSGLLLINKLCLKEVALPSFLAVMQFVASVLCALGLAATGQAELDGLAWPRVRVYLMYIGLFATAIYSNMQALTHSNVETLIVFRACGPLMVSLLEWRLLGRTLPSRRSVLALFGIFLFALGYVASDKAFGAPARFAHTPARTSPAPHPPHPYRLRCAPCSDARAARVLVVRRLLHLHLLERHVW